MKEAVLATDSLVVFQNSQGIQARGTLMRLSRNAAVFEVYNPYSIVQLSEVLTDFHVRRGDRTIYTGRAVVSNLVSTGLLLIVSVTLVDPWSDLIDLSPGPELREEVARFIQDWETSHQHIRPSYELCVSKMHNFLEELSRWLEHGEAVAGIKDNQNTIDFVKAFVADVDTKVGPKLDEIFNEFDQEAQKVSVEETPLHKAFVRRELHPLILCSPFLHRTFTKPLGYAGDYEMVNMILRDPWEGSNTYARLVNAVFLRTGTAQGHRNRIDNLLEYLRSETKRVQKYNRPCRVMNVGCGPAVEVQRFVKDAVSDHAEMELLDFNEETIRYASNEIEQSMRESRSKVKIRYIHRSIHHLLKEASARKIEATPSYDYVYCAGLFDYLSDRVCKRLVRLFYEWTVPGGLVVVTNVHANNPARGIMDHLQDWSLLLRSESDMAGLISDLGQQCVMAEPTGTNVFLEIRKPEGNPCSREPIIKTSFKNTLKPIAS